MKFKKLASLALACVMALSLAVPAFAADPNLGNTETAISGTYTPPDIKVVVPQTAAAFINPLGLDVDVATGVTLSNRQIISAPMAIKNQGASDLQVGATVSVTVNASSDLRFTTATTGGTGATKTVFAYLQAKQEPTLVGATSVVTDAKINEAYGKWDASNYDSTKDIVVNSAMPASKDNLVILRAATVTGGTFAAYKAGSIALVRLAGDCVAAPTTGAWAKTVAASGDTPASGDGFTVTVAYTFKPAAITKYDITVGAVDYKDSINSGATVTASEAKAAEGDVVTLNVVAPAGGALTIKATTPDGASTKPVALVHDADNAQVSAGTNSVIVNGLKTGETGGPAATTTTITFTMPAGAVTIAAEVADRT